MQMFNNAIQKLIFLSVVIVPNMAGLFGDDPNVHIDRWYNAADGKKGLDVLPEDWFKRNSEDKFGKSRRCAVIKLILGCKDIDHSLTKPEPAEDIGENSKTIYENLEDIKSLFETQRLCDLSQITQFMKVINNELIISKKELSEFKHTMLGGEDCTDAGNATAKANATAIFESKIGALVAKHMRAQSPLKSAEIKPQQPDLKNMMDQMRDQIKNEILEEVKGQITTMFKEQFDGRLNILESDKQNVNGEVVNECNAAIEKRLDAVEKQSQTNTHKVTKIEECMKTVESLEQRVISKAAEEIRKVNEQFTNALSEQKGELETKVNTDISEESRKLKEELASKANLEDQTQKLRTQIAVVDEKYKEQMQIEKTRVESKMEDIDAATKSLKNELEGKLEEQKTELTSATRKLKQNCDAKFATKDELSEQEKSLKKGMKSIHDAMESQTNGKFEQLKKSFREPFNMILRLTYGDKEAKGFYPYNKKTYKDDTKNFANKMIGKLRFETPEPKPIDSDYKCVQDRPTQGLAKRLINGINEFRNRVGRARKAANKQGETPGATVNA